MATPSRDFDYGKRTESGQYEHHPTLEWDYPQLRTIRKTYIHTRCNQTTTCGRDIARTYAAKPTFYKQTFCAACKDYFPVGRDGEFFWLDRNGGVTNERVGT